MMDAQAETKMCPECNNACDAAAQFCPECGFPVGAVSRANGDALVGRVLPGGYHVLELIGVGGMGRVYRAQQRALGRTVAVKVIHPYLASEQRSLARFLTEARATSLLNHPNTISVIDFGQTNEGQPYLVMEFLRGRNLSQIVASEGLLPVRRVLGIIHQVLLALGEAHALEIVHRDLKPDNIIVEPMRRGGDFIKVVDFGLAKLKQDDGQTGITKPGIVCGTPDFMAPEQGRGDAIDGRSDLYAVGVILYWMLCGRLPFQGNTPTQVVMMHIANPVPDPKAIAPGREMPDTVISLVYTAMAKKPEDRFADAHTFADAVSVVIQDLEGEPQKSAPRNGSALFPRESVGCSFCRATVPWGKFCLECGSALPTFAASAPASTARDRRLQFVGRDEEFRWLDDALERSARRFVIVRLVGEAGAGKSRLLTEFAQNKRTAAHVVFGQPDPFWSFVPAYALRQVVRRLLGTEFEVAGDEPISLVLRELLRGDAADTLTPEVRRRGYLDALAFALRVGQKRAATRLVVVFDDLERMDGVTLQAIEDLARAGADSRALVVVTHGPRLDVPWAEHAGDDESLRFLGGLPGVQAAELLQAQLRGRTEFALASVSAGGVSPLYLQQVLCFTLDGGTEPPPRLADLVTQRFSSLDGAGRRCVQALAVLGDHVEASTLMEFLDSTDGEQKTKEELTALLDDLLDCGLVSREDDTATLSLAHPLLYDLARLTIPAEARRELHARAALLFRNHGAPVEVIAEHAYLGQDAMTALVALEQAAERSAARGDRRSATHLLQRGLELARLEIHRGELEDPLSAVVIFGRRLGAILLERDRMADARGVLQEVLGATPPNSQSRASVLALLGEVAQRTQQFHDAEKLLRQAVECARASSAPEEWLEGLELRLASIQTYVGAPETLPPGE